MYVSMKTIELKCWGIWLFGIITVLCLVSCKTSDLNKHKTLEEVKADLVENTQEAKKAEVNSESQINENEVKELVSLLQNLNIGYDGKEVSDKLDFLLNKTDEGTKLTIQGKGTANYTETNKREFESLKTEIFKRQDSLHNLQASALHNLRADIYQFSKEKDKQVEVTGFQFGFYLWLFFIVVAILILRYIAIKFNLFDRFKLTSKPNEG